ncbi:MAG: bifunctional riboflavin kinase/FAD synthetase [Firmicutes bacterium]|nr:bifunctional riboflavin kinase/FAD synthetase [Bacillota bacterium]
MKIFRSLEEIENIEETAVALGNFDGVHLGHQALIREAVAYASAHGLKSAVFTFENHPRNVLAGHPVIQNILYPADKEKILEEMGVDYLFSIPFDPEIGKMHPETFIEDILWETFLVKVAFCGFNYCFGAKGAGTAELLSSAGEALGFEVRVLPPYKVEGEVVSSTLIRSLIDEGRMEECSKFLGRSYGIAGEVVTGQQLGRTIGFPTVNLNLDEDMVSPPNGVYVTCCEFDGISYPSITNVGRKPTVGEFARNAETHLLDFSGDLYGKEIRVSFLEKIRDEKKFDGLEALQEQIHIDCEYAKAWHKKNDPM